MTSIKAVLMTTASGVPTWCPRLTAQWAGQVGLSPETREWTGGSGLRLSPSEEEATSPAWFSRVLVCLPSSIPAALTLEHESPVSEPPPRASPGQRAWGPAQPFASLFPGDVNAGGVDTRL